MMKVLGDTHLGRRFVHNVPLHRRGELEAMQRRYFLEGIEPGGNPFHVHMGDLFDHADVSLDTIMFAADAYKRVARKNPKATFLILRGNHDKGRDLEKVTAFDVFTALVAGVENIVVVETWDTLANAAFFGWDPIRSAEETIAEADLEGIDMVFGHWDVDLRSPPFNLIPTKLLAEKGIKTAYTGHVHAESTFERDGVDVIVTGSMMGFAHGEGLPYVTLTPDELETTDVKDLCVRLKLGADDDVGEIPNCLHFTVVREEADAVELEDVELGEFDLDSLYQETFEALDLVADVKKEVDKKWRQTFTKQG